MATSRQLIGAAGALFFVLYVVNIALQGPPPMFDDPVSESRAWFADNRDRFLAGAFIGAFAFAFGFLPFVAGFYGLLRKAESADPAWPRLFFIGAILVASIGPVSYSFRGVMAMGLADAASDDTVRILLGMSYFTDAFSYYTAVPLFTGAALAILQTGVVWRWTAYLALALAALCVVSVAAIFSTTSDSIFSLVGFLTLIGFVAWVLAVSVSLLLPERAGKAESTTVPAA